MKTFRKNLNRGKTKRRKNQNKTRKSHFKKGGRGRQFGTLGKTISDEVLQFIIFKNIDQKDTLEHDVYDFLKYNWSKTNALKNMAENQANNTKIREIVENKEAMSWIMFLYVKHKEHIHKNRDYQGKIARTGVFNRLILPLKHTFKMKGMFEDVQESAFEGVAMILGYVSKILETNDSTSTKYKPVDIDFKQNDKHGEFTFGHDGQFDGEVVEKAMKKIVEALNSEKQIEEAARKKEAEENISILEGDELIPKSVNE